MARIIFAGTPDFARPCLAALLKAYEVIAVYTQPDRPAGRGHRLQPSPVKQLAVDHQIPVYQPTSLKTEAEQQRLRELQADLMVVVAYGLLLPPAVLEAPRLGCINVHASLLPRWRGAAPIQRAILAGDAETGISIMQMDAGLDTGPVYYQRALSIAADETGGSLHDKLARLGAETLLQALPDILAGRARAKPQNDELATYAHKLDKQEAWIDWSQSAVQIERQVRAFNPWPVAYTAYQGQNLRIWQAQALPSSGSAPHGQIIAADEQGIRVSTGDGDLLLLELQLPSKKRISAADFIHAYPTAGIVLGQ